MSSGSGGIQDRPPTIETVDTMQISNSHVHACRELRDLSESEKG